MTHQISVTPVAGGWMMESDFAAPVVFSSGARAERAARDLAGKLSGAGVTSLVTIRLRDGSIASRFVCPAIEVLLGSHGRKVVREPVESAA